ncbi:MAG: HAD-IIA family hydrolase [Aquificaceae bacterium]|nr:HAD-IIA family hydrolase [Aquificaceae bacterium]MCX8059610.1 HAD-IIA family hydrolase [Aquificaceae bacterium]MDW8096834.1 HAD-IIA family hydrolase [Aquificaceae bacterium]
MNRVALLLDMDGVLVKDKALNPFPDTVHFIQALRDLCLPFRVVSNNSTKPPHKIVQELCLKGIHLKEDEFLSPLSLIGNYLKDRGVRRVLFLGMPEVERYLQELGFEVSKDYRVEAVVVGQDRGLNFEKLKLATSALLLGGALLVPVNLSRLVKDDDGLYFPGAGSVALLLAHACNYEEKLPNLGKPSREFIELALRGLSAQEVYLVSDDLYTDLMGAKEMGLKTVFMTTGKYGEEEPSRAGFVPDLTFHSLSQLLEHLHKAVLF